MRDGFTGDIVMLQEFIREKLAAVLGKKIKIKITRTTKKNLKHVKKACLAILTIAVQRRRLSSVELCQS